MTFIDYIAAILFGIVEGITEWLPVSSTGHMIILNELIKINVSDDFLDLYLVVIQLGAILAVILYFWKDIWPFGIKDNNVPFKTEGFGRYIKKDKFIMWFKIAYACIPAVIVGVFFDDMIDELFYNYVCVAIMLIVLGIAFILIENFIKDKEPECSSIEDLTFTQAFLIGMFQLVAAVFPGTSRSGATIAGSLMIGISRKVAAEFTFYLAIPVMLGASLLKILKFDGDASASDVIMLLIGMVVAFAVSLIVIKFFMGFIKKHDFKVFGWYRIVLGIIVILFFTIRG